MNLQRKKAKTPIDQLDKTKAKYGEVKMIKVCFVCTGNTCRSIMAERLMKKNLKDRKIKDISVSSKGLNANGENITENAKKALKFFKANAKDRKSIKLKKIDNNILYVTMTEGQKNQIKSNKVISFKALIGKEILDPYGQGEEVYLQTCNDLIDGINILIDKLIKWR